MLPTYVELFLANLAVSDIIHADAGVVLWIHFKNLSVQKQVFYGGRNLS